MPNTNETEKLSMTIQTADCDVDAIDPGVMTTDSEYMFWPDFDITLSPAPHGYNTAWLWPLPGFLLHLVPGGSKININDRLPANSRVNVNDDPDQIDLWAVRSVKFSRGPYKSITFTFDDSHVDGFQKPLLPSVLEALAFGKNWGSPLTEAAAQVYLTRICALIEEAWGQRRHAQRICEKINSRDVQKIVAAELVKTGSCSFLISKEECSLDSNLAALPYVPCHATDWVKNFLWFPLVNVVITSTEDTTEYLFRSAWYEADRNPESRRSWNPVEKPKT